MSPRTVASEQPEFYDDPLLYDVLYSPGTDQEVNLLELIDKEYSDVRTPAARRVWLEPACGSGRYLRELSRRGRRCIGFDIHEGMLGYARAHIDPEAHHRCHVLCADLREFTPAVGLDVADFAFIPVNTIRHLMTGMATARHFRDMGRALRPGGLYVVGISLSCYGEEDIVEDSWEGRRGSLRVHQSISYIPPEPDLRREQVVSHLRVQRGRRVEYHDSTYWLRSYDRTQWRDLVSRGPFDRVASLDDDGNPVGDRSLDYQLEVLRLPQL